MLHIRQFGSLEALLTSIQILDIYGKNQPKTNQRHEAQNNKLSAVYLAEIYNTAESSQYE